MAHGLHMHEPMATGLKLVWSSSAGRAPGPIPPAGSPLPGPCLVEARALVDDWVCAGFESGPAAIDDLAARIAAAFARRDARLAIGALPVQVEEAPVCG